MLLLLITFVVQYSTLIASLVKARSAPEMRAKLGVNVEKLDISSAAFFYTPKIYRFLVLVCYLLAGSK